MSRLDDLGEILDGVGERSCPKSEWSHTYRCASNNKIQGSFTYRDKDNILTVAYTLSNGILDLGTLNSISKYLDPFERNENNVQARLCRKENKDLLEAMVEAELPGHKYLDNTKKDETYQKHKLVPYIEILSRLCDAVANEEDEQFKPYKSEVQTGIKIIIKKLLEDKQDSDQTDLGYGSASPATIRENELIKKELQQIKNKKLLLIDNSGSMPDPMPKKGLGSKFKNIIAGAALTLGTLMGYSHNDTIRARNIIKEKEPKSYNPEKEDTPSGRGNDE